MIVIHIGLKKTGSTSLQRFLSTNEKKLRVMGVDYSQIGQNHRSNHINLFYEVRGHQKFNPKYGTLAQVADSRRESSNNVLVLSSEDFEDFDDSEVARFKAALNSPHEDIRIVMVARDLIDMTPSEYSQKIRNGLDLSDFDKFFENRTRRREIPLLKTAERWADNFGWESLRIRLLDRAQLVNGDLADDFLTSTGLDPNKAEVQRLDRPGVANASPGWRVQEAVRALYTGEHRLPEGHPLSAPQGYEQPMKKAIGRFSRKLGIDRGWNADRGRYLSREQAQQCLEIHGAAVTALNARLSDKLHEPLDLDARGFVEREFMPDAAHIPSVELREFYDELAKRISRHKRPA